MSFLQTRKYQQYINKFTNPNFNEKVCIIERYIYCGIIQFYLAIFGGLLESP